MEFPYKKGQFLTCRRMSALPGDRGSHDFEFEVLSVNNEKAELRDIYTLVTWRMRMLSQQAATLRESDATFESSHPMYLTWRVNKVLSVDEASEKMSAYSASLEQAAKTALDKHQRYIEYQLSHTPKVSA